MKKNIAIGLALFTLLTLVISACAIRDTAGSASGPTVHMGGASFIQSSITIKKGDTLTLVDDAAVPHVITNGTWDNGKMKTEKEAGAPTVSLNYTGNDTLSTPAFTTAGTFKLLCTIHGNMNLTVTVQ